MNANNSISIHDWKNQEQSKFMTINLFTVKYMRADYSSGQLETWPEVQTIDPHTPVEEYPPLWRTVDLF